MKKNINVAHFLNKQIKSTIKDVEGINTNSIITTDDRDYYQTLALLVIAHWCAKHDSYKWEN